MGIKQKFIIAISTILIISFSIIGFTYAFFVNKPVKEQEKTVDNHLYLYYQDKEDSVTLSNLTDSIVIYKYIKLNSDINQNYSFKLTTSYDTTSFRDGISEEEVQVNPSLIASNPDGYYDDIFISLVSSDNIDKNNLESSYNNGKVIYNESNLIKDQIQVLDSSSIKETKYYILKIELKNNPLLPVNNMSNVKILLSIDNDNVIIK